MDDEKLARLQSDLVRWGVLAPTGREITPRFRAALARAASALQRSEAAGVPTLGDPVRNAVALALGDLPKPPGESASPEHVLFVTAVEVATFPSNLQDLLRRRA